MFYYGSMHRLISWIVLSFGFISVSFLCLYLCSFYLHLVYDLIINKWITVAEKLHAAVCTTWQLYYLKNNTMRPNKNVPFFIFLITRRKPDNFCSLATVVSGADKYFLAALSKSGNWLDCQNAWVVVERWTRGCSSNDVNLSDNDGRGRTLHTAIFVYLRAGIVK